MAKIKCKDCRWYGEIYHGQIMGMPDVDKVCFHPKTRLSLKRNRKELELCGPDAKRFEEKGHNEKNS